MFGLILCIFVFTVLLMFQVYNLLTRKERLINNRLKSALKNSETGHSSPPILARKKSTHSISNLFTRLGNVFSKAYLDKVQISLVKSGIPLKAEEFAGINLLLVLVAFGAGFLVFGNILMMTCLGAIGFILPGLWVKVEGRRRVLKIEGQLLDTTILLASSLRAGHSFMQALELASKEMPHPLAGELSKVIRETQLGVPLEDSLVSLTQRVDSKDLEMLITGVLIQRQVGGNLAEVLDTIAVTIDKRIKVRAKIRALTAQGRMSAWIVSLLPFGIAAFVFGMHPEFGRVMLIEPLGQAMLAGGVLFLILGIFWIRMVINIEV